MTGLKYLGNPKEFCNAVMFLVADVEMNESHLLAMFLGQASQLGIVKSILTCIFQSCTRVAKHNDRRELTTFNIASKSLRALSTKRRKWWVISISKILWACSCLNSVIRGRPASSMNLNKSSKS